MNETYKVQVQDLVDDLKSVFTHAGLGGEAGEYKLLTQSFLYKFLNDKFLYQAKCLDEVNTYEHLLTLSEDDYDWLLEDIGTSTAWLKPDQLIETLHRQQNEPTFYETFENSLNQIAIDNNDIFSVHTDGDTAIRLFDERLITDTSQIVASVTKWQNLSSISLHASSLMRPFFHKASTFSQLSLST